MDRDPDRTSRGSFGRTRISIRRPHLQSEAARCRFEFSRRADQCKSERCDSAMKAGPEFAWRQLVAQKGHFAAALAGVAFAVTLMLGQIGLRDSLLATAVRLYSRLNAD